MTSLRSRTLARHLGAAAFLIAAGAGAARAGGLQSLEQFVKNTQSGKAAFTQVVTVPTRQAQGSQPQAARSRTQTGTFQFQRPGKFRFDYARPFEQVIVADGRTLWLYDVDLNQVTARQQEQVLGSTPAAIVAAAPDLKTLERDFTLTEEPDAAGQQWVRAVPKASGGQLKAIRVGFRAAAPGAAPELSTLEIEDAFGQRSVLTFSDVQANARAAAGAFEFKPPAGADVMRQ